MRTNKFLAINTIQMFNRYFVGLVFSFLLQSGLSCAQSDVKVIDYMDQTKSYSQQGAALYNKYLFQFTALGICDVYDMKKKQHIAQMNYESSTQKHCDTACFGWYKVDKKDDFPVIYVSGSQIWQNKEHGLIWVYRIVHKKKKWGLSLVQIIKTPQIENTGICPDALLESSDSTMWIMGWKTDISHPKKDGSGADLTFMKFKVPSLNEGHLDGHGIRTTEIILVDTLESFDIHNAHIVQQGLCLRNKKVYVPYGGSTDGYQGIDVISLKERRVIKSIDLMGTKVFEPEAVFFYKDEMFVADQATTIKKIVDQKGNE